MALLHIMDAINLLRVVKMLDLMSYKILFDFPNNSDVMNVSSKNKYLLCVQVDIKTMKKRKSQGSLTHLKV